MGKSRKTGLLGEGVYHDKVMFNDQGKIWGRKERKKNLIEENWAEWEVDMYVGAYRKIEEASL